MTGKLFHFLATVVLFLGSHSLYLIIIVLLHRNEVYVSEWAFVEYLLSLSCFTYGFVMCRYKSLDVKNILLETVSHHILPQMLMYPLWNDLGDLLKDYLKFMDDHFRESADLTFLAYRHRNYSKVYILFSVLVHSLVISFCMSFGFVFVYY